MITPRSEENKILTWRDLHAADFTFNQPFQLKLQSGAMLRAENAVRILPGRRMVVFGVWQDKPIVAKLFFDETKARQHSTQDAAGVVKMLENKIPTPALYEQTVSEDGRIDCLIFERIIGANGLQDIWQAEKEYIDTFYLLKSVIIELATQHVLGMLQHDLHLQNFLITDKTIYTLDGAQIEVFPDRLNKKTSMMNLALFLSQLGIGMEEYQEKLFRHYAIARGWALKEEDVTEMKALIKQWHDQRWQRYAKKIMRDCTEFSCTQNAYEFVMLNRAYAGPEMTAFLKNPEAIFQLHTITMLKNGRSSTVIRVPLDGMDMVIKRYNLKNLWHRIRRCLRSTRAANCWRLAQKLQLFYINTAKPIAFVENRFMGLRGTSYFVSAFVPGKNAHDYFQQHPTDITMIKKISRLLKNLAKCDITHGDLKASNILIDEHNQPLLIDLDGAREHVSLASLNSAWRREIQRFYANFKEMPEVEKGFRNELAV